MSTDIALEISGISRHFGGLRALSDVSMQVGRGEILGLIGPNGAGKSTLFEVISGGMPPSAGRVIFFGKDITRLPPHRRRRIGLCRTFQKVKLFNNLTVRENVKIAALEASKGPGAISDVLADMLARLSLEHLANRAIHELTLADRKRVEIARAAIGCCRLLMLDESLSGLTHNEADEIISEIRYLNVAYGITIIIVEHVMPIVMTLAQRLVVLSYGKVIAQGRPAQIVRNPTVIAAYLGQRKIA